MSNVLKTSYDTQELENLELDFSHDEIFENLKNDTCEDFVKIFSIINLKELKNVDEAHILFHHLTNHPTPIREAVALKLEEIYDEKFFDEYIKEKFVKSVIDINPNVCRAMCNIVSRSSLLIDELCLPLISCINTLLDEIKDNDKELGGFYDNALKVRKNHAKNKKLFSLYWFLECLSLCNVKKNNSAVLEIVNQTIKFNDYTIREKTAKILNNLENVSSELLKIAQNDQNFYVKNQVYDKINFED